VIYPILSLEAIFLRELLYQVNIPDFLA